MGQSKDMNETLCHSIHHAAQLEHSVVTCRHELNKTDLFSDEKLLAILQSHPDEYLQIYTMGDDHRELDDFRLGNRGSVSAESLLSAVKTGKLWFNIMGLDYFHPEYKPVMDQLFDELEAVNPEFKTFDRSATLLISSPNAKVYYHADGPPNILWHIRGRKRVSLYPSHLAGQIDVEKIFTRESNDDLPYDPSFDKVASDFVLGEGDMIAWPQNMPHRVDNLDAFCVSLSAEYFSKRSLRKKQLYIANHYLRRWLKLPCYGRQLFGVMPWLKINAYRVLCRLPFKRAQMADDHVEFDLKDVMDVKP